MCLLTNPQNKRVITGFKNEKEEETEEEVVVMLPHRKKQALWKQVDCNKIEERGSERGGDGEAKKEQSVL